MPAPHLRVVLSAIVLFAGTAQAKTAPHESWGKAAVSFEDYRADSIACVRETFYLDTRETEPVKALKTAERQIDTALANTGTTATDLANTAQRVAMAKQAIRPERRFQEVATLQRGVLADCLTRHGYRRFVLTPEQDAALAKLPARSQERHAFLHRLASDPAILAAQGT